MRTTSYLSTIATTGCVALLLATSTPAAGDENGEEQDELSHGSVVTVAGTGEAGYSGDGGEAVDARLSGSMGGSLSIDLDDEGNLYIADAGNDRIRVVDPDGEIDTLPGTHGPRSPDTDGPEVDGWIFSPSNTPRAVATTPTGEIYVAARKGLQEIDTDGDTTTIAGDGDANFRDDGDGGDGGPATEAELHEPPDVAADDDGNLYIADKYNNRIRVVDTDGEISTLVGGGEDPISPDMGPTDATDVGGDQLGSFESVAVGPSGTVYFTIRDEPAVFGLDPDGTLRGVAGTDEDGDSGDGGPATDAQLSDRLGQIAVDEEERLYIPDTANNVVRVVDSEGTISTIPARFSSPHDVAVGPDGNLYVAGNSQVQMFVQADDAPPDEEETSPSPEPGPDPWADESPGTVRHVAGEEHEQDDPELYEMLHPGEEETEGPRHLASDSAGTVYFSDTAGHRVYGVDTDGDVTPVAGTGEEGFSGDDGPATDAQLDSPRGVAVDEDDHLYIADARNARVRVVDEDGDITTVAGGDATEETITTPHDVAVGPDDTLYLTEFDPGRIRAVDPDGDIETIAGGGDRWADEGDGHPATDASLWDTSQIAVDSAGNVYFIEHSHQSVRMVDTDGQLSTVAGDSYFSRDEGGFSGDDGPATEAELNTPLGIAVDKQDQLHIADTYNSRIRVVDNDGDITTLAGTGAPHDTGDGGLAEEADLNEPQGIALDSDGTLHLASPDSNQLRQIDPDGDITTHLDLNEVHDESDGPATEVELRLPSGLGADAAGNLYIADTGNGVVRVVDPDGQITTHPAWQPDNEDGLVDPQHTPEDLTVTAAGDVYAVMLASDRMYGAKPDGTLRDVAGGGQLPPEDGAAAQTVQLGVSHISTDPDDKPHFVQEDSVFRLEDDQTITAIAGEATGDEAEGWEFADDDTDSSTDSTTDGGTSGPSATHPIAVGPDGEVYFAEDMANRVRKIEGDGTISTVAGNGEDFGSNDDIGDGGPAPEAVVRNPGDVVADSDGTVYLTSATGIRMVDPDGTIETIVESESEEDSFGNTTRQPPDALALDAHGNLYFTQPATNQVQVIVRPGEMGSLSALQVALISLGALALLTGAAAIALRDQLGMLARNPRRIPGAVAALPILTITALLDGVSHIEKRLARTGTS